MKRNREIEELTWEELQDKAPTKAVLESLYTTKTKIMRYDNILCSISGGSDSDVLLDLCERLDDEGKINYIFFDTGLEFNATKDHLKYLERKYDIRINIVKAIKPIPVCCKEFGQPFLSKQVSEWIERLQRHGFQWEDKPLRELVREYPKCKAALRWWCNDYPKMKGDRESKFNIAYNQYLKEFMIENPPSFKISNKCCQYAKKKVAENTKKNGNYDLNIHGVRKAEGGARANAYKNCFTSSDKECDDYRPIFWYKNDDKEQYERVFGVEHSKCYTEYGMKRTGCAGCPFARDFEQELSIMKEYEPKLYKAAENVFKDAYDYMRRYKEYRAEKKLAEEGKQKNG